MAHVQPGTMPGEFDRYNMKRSVSLTANIAGEDLGRIASHVERAIGRAGAPPKGATVDVRGQIRPMEEILQGLGIGLGMSIIVILLLLTANFQSVKLALIVVSTTPAVVAGVVLMLWLTGTTVNLQSFMGSIMAIGVAVANAILLVTFAEQHRREEGAEAGRAATEGAKGRLRPILMTSCAMTAGMVPMALGWSEGSEQTAPLARAVDRRPGRRDDRDPDRAPYRFRAGPGLGWSGVGLARSRRPREHALPRRGSRRDRDGPAFGQRRFAGSPAPSYGGRAVGWRPRSKGLIPE